MENKILSVQGLTRRKFLKYGFYSSLAGGFTTSFWLNGCSKRSEKKLNIVIISIDTLRADHLSCYGYKYRTSPNIDQLALRGHRFSRAYTTMPTTLPAHASLFSSLYPSQLSSRRNGEKVSVEATMLAEILQSSDYATAAFVSASVMDSRYGLNQGFQTYEDAKRTSRPAVDALAKAKTWLKNHSADPFFLFMHFYDPHTFYHAPERFRNKFGAPNRKEPPERSFIKNPSRFTPQLVREVISAYDAEIAYADWATGELLRTLTQLGLDDHTLVILLSDHGESLDELIPRYGFAFGHGSFLYTYMLQIPMIIYMPRKIYQKENMIHATPVSIIDIMPTILDILQIESPGSIAGCSLLPMLRGERMSRGPIFSERRSFVKPPKSYLTGEDYSVVDEN